MLVGTMVLICNSCCWYLSCEATVWRPILLIWARLFQPWKLWAGSRDMVINEWCLKQMTLWLCLWLKQLRVPIWIHVIKLFLSPYPIFSHPPWSFHMSSSIMQTLNYSKEKSPWTKSFNSWTNLMNVFNELTISSIH